MAELVSSEHKAFVVSKIRSLLPDVEILAFGSRIRGDARTYSDLDLALRAEKPLPLRLLSQLEESFAESSIPYKIDLSDFAMVDEEFQKIILKNAVRW
jgi:predicted nucleotidyltransferase